ncbi:uncharacterized protein TM35_000084510 [Trypanosoma theileri]|uniref:Uncharacterized protein n=1 Tax=Trypanosoma theileri TaxID=67003 RepID=A0A1X0P1S4_9TRYP|nr:uncharacterized protein TM35_000084510 [Trypanosoma theileri]ORC90653.1 hypothetical protein TM35_000084510 [Trypanosoma theileri]
MEKKREGEKRIRSPQTRLPVQRGGAGWKKIIWAPPPETPPSVLRRALQAILGGGGWWVFAGGTPIGSFPFPLEEKGVGGKEGKAAASKKNGGPLCLFFCMWVSIL